MAVYFASQRLLCDRIGTAWQVPQGISTNHAYKAIQEIGYHKVLSVSELIVRKNRCVISNNTHITHNYIVFVFVALSHMVRLSGDV